MLAKAATPTVDISVNGDTWTMVSSGLKDITTVAKLGVETDDTTVDGRKVKVMIVYFLYYINKAQVAGSTLDDVDVSQVVFTMDGNKWVQKEHWDGKEAVYTREVVGDELVVVCILHHPSRFPTINQPSSITFQTIVVGDVKCIRKYKRV